MNNTRNVFYPPVIANQTNFALVLKPRTPITSRGRLIGSVVTNTGLDGRFVIEKSDLINTDESIVIRKTSSDTVELETFTISDNINVVAYVNSEYYSFREIDYKNKDLIDLRLRMP